MSSSLAGTKEQLLKAKNTARQAIALIENLIATSNKQLAEMHSKAAHLPDGTAIFYDDTSGEVYTENGNLLTGDEVRNIQIPDDAPRWNDYRAAIEHKQQLREHKEQIQSDQRNIIDPIERRLHNQDNPPNVDELNDMLIQLEEVKSSHDAIINDFINHQQPPQFNTLSAAKDILGKSSINGPPIYDAFNGARSDNADQETSTPDRPENNKGTVRFDVPDL